MLVLAISLIFNDCLLFDLATIFKKETHKFKSCANSVEFALNILEL